MTKDEWIRFSVKTLDAVRIMMKNRDRLPHEEAIYTAVRHCIDEMPPTGKLVGPTYGHPDDRSGNSP